MPTIRKCYRKLFTFYLDHMENNRTDKLSVDLLSDLEGNYVARQPASARIRDFIAGMTDDFFSKQKCDRCKGSLRVRTMSWFTAETICGDCGAKETELRKKMRQQGQDPDSMEGIGYLPKLKSKKEDSHGC